MRRYKYYYPIYKKPEKRFNEYGHNMDCACERCTPKMPMIKFQQTDQHNKNCSCESCMKTTTVYQ